MIGDKTLIQHVYDCASLSGANKVIIATDDDRIEDVARSFGATTVMTSVQHQSGTDRLHEAVTILGCADQEIIVNVQGDEYGLDPGLINKVASALANDSEVQMATLCIKIPDQATWLEPNAVKVVRDTNNHALYFSRAPIPSQSHQHADNVNPCFGYRHIGIYAYRCGFLRTFASLPKANIELTESLEQLRALYHGYRIRVEEVPGKAGIEINTEEDVQLARKQMKAG